jgi:hypothetical protein
MRSPKKSVVSTPLPFASITPRLLRIVDAAHYLSVTNWFMENLLREKVVPSFIQGKRKVVDIRDLDAYVDRLKSGAYFKSQAA